MLQTLFKNWAGKIRDRKVRGEEVPHSQPAIGQLREKFREAVPLLQFTVEPLVPKEIQDAIATHEEESKKLKTQYGMREKRRKLEAKMKRPRPNNSRIGDLMNLDKRQACGRHNSQSCS